MDMVSCVCNIFWFSLFLFYVWLNSFIIYLLYDVRGYIFVISCIYLLDLWCYSFLIINKKCWLYDCLNSWLILF